MQRAGARQRDRAQALLLRRLEQLDGPTLLGHRQQGLLHRRRDRRQDLRRLEALRFVEQHPQQPRLPPQRPHPGVEQVHQRARAHQLAPPQHHQAAGRRLEVQQDPQPLAHGALGVAHGQRHPVLLHVPQPQPPLLGQSGQNFEGRLVDLAQQGLAPHRLRQADPGDEGLGAGWRQRLHLALQRLHQQLPLEARRARQAHAHQLGRYHPHQISFAAKAQLPQQRPQGLPQPARLDQLPPAQPALLQRPPARPLGPPLPQPQQAQVMGGEQGHQPVGVGLRARRSGGPQPRHRPSPPRRPC